MSSELEQLKEFINEQLPKEVYCRSYDDPRRGEITFRIDLTVQYRVTRGTLLKEPRRTLGREIGVHIRRKFLDLFKENQENEIAHLRYLLYKHVDLVHLIP